MSIRYVNAYEVSRCYGGPEEGGWWYDAGEPLASIPCQTDEEIEAARQRIKETIGPNYEGRRTRFSVIGDSNLEILIQDHAARDYPTERPHYE